jgi:hypothetical protein
LPSGCISDQFIEEPTSALHDKSLPRTTSLHLRLVRGSRRAARASPTDAH